MNTENDKYKNLVEDDGYGGYLNSYTEEAKRKEEQSKIEEEEITALDIAKEKFKLVVANAREKSKKNVEITYDNKKTVKMTAGEFTAKVSAFALVIVLAATGIISSIKYAPEIINKITYPSYVKTVSREESMDAGLMLSEAGLNVVPQDDNGNWFNNYDKLENVTEDDIYGFYCYFGREETEKVVQALGYTGWDNFLSMNGYYDESGNPSIEVWLNYAEAKNVAEYKASK